MNTAVSAPQALGQRAERWWLEYCHPVTGNPGTRAKLRRCRSAADALYEVAALDLARRLGGFGKRAGGDGWTERALDLARVLAHVNENTSERPMRQLGWRTFPGAKRDAEAAANERPLLSEVRFRRLLDAKPGEELVTAFVRLVRLMKGAANVPALSSAFLRWNARTRKQWAFDYYAAAIAVPPEQDIDSESDQ